MKKKLIQTATFGVPEYEMRPEANYRPRISPEQLAKLWLLKHKTGRPITHLVAEAIEEYLKRQRLEPIRFEERR